MFIRNLDLARSVIKACKFGTNRVCWSRLSESERMILRDAFYKAHIWGGDKLPKAATQEMEISISNGSNIDWQLIFEGK